MLHSPDKLRTTKRIHLGEGEGGRGGRGGPRGWVRGETWLEPHLPFLLKNGGSGAGGGERVGGLGRRGPAKGRGEDSVGTPTWAGTPTPHITLRFFGVLTQLEDEQMGCAGLPVSFSLRISTWRPHKA